MQSLIETRTAFVPLISTIHKCFPFHRLIEGELLTFLDDHYIYALFYSCMAHTSLAILHIALVDHFGSKHNVAQE